MTSQVTKYVLVLNLKQPKLIVGRWMPFSSSGIISMGQICQAGLLVVSLKVDSELSKIHFLYLTGSTIYTVNNSQQGPQSAWRVWRATVTHKAGKKGTDVALVVALPVATVLVVAAVVVLGVFLCRKYEGNQKRTKTGTPANSYSSFFSGAQSQKIHS